jgi:DNA-binding transcriptional LysR family regulator
MSLPIEFLLLLLNVSRTGSVKHAARRMDVSSSTAHRQLTEVRAYYRDQLFRHAQGGLQFTALGRELISILERLEKAYLAAHACGKPDLAQQRRELRIGHPMRESSVMHSDLIDLAMGFDHGVRLLLMPIRGERFEALRDHSVDFLISTKQAAPGGEFQSLALPSERLVLVCDPELAAAKAGAALSDEEVLRYAFVDVLERSLDGHEHLMRSTYFAQWRAAESAHKIPLAAAIGASLAKSKLLMVLSERYALLLQMAQRAAIVHTVSGPALVERRLYWHQSMHEDTFMQWIRSIFTEAPALER